jgi:uncharacterized protein YdbL (DUF1318 family)
MKPVLGLIYFAATLLAFAGTSFGKADLKDRMKERLPKVLAAKNAGTVGEGSDGLLYVRPSAGDNDVKLAKDENSDRTSYFVQAAKAVNASPSDIAKQWAKGMWAKGSKGHWYRSSKGSWSQK